MNGDNTTQFLSSGTEDYFLSASYFDEGVFAGSEAGLTWRGAGGDLSAYKTHQRDVLPFHGGMQFVWRNNEDGRSCPNRWPQASRPSTTPTGLRTGPMNLTSIVYFCESPPPPCLYRKIAPQPPPLPPPAHTPHAQHSHTDAWPAA